jgi:hypothetical protein
LGIDDDEVLAKFSKAIDRGPERIATVEQAVAHLRHRLEEVSRAPFAPQNVTVLSDGIAVLYEVKLADPESLGNREAVEQSGRHRGEALRALRKFYLAQRANDLPRMVSSVEVLQREIVALASS